MKWCGLSWSSLKSLRTTGSWVFCRTAASKVLGRDHYPDCFSLFMAGGGVKAGHAHGETSHDGSTVVDGAVHFRDLHATILHLMGIDHTRLSFPHQGLNQRLTGVEERRVITNALA